MNFLVCISKTPDTTTKIQFIENNTKFNSDKVQYILNPYDEWYALVRAIELKEQLGGKVVCVNVGGADNEPIIRKALAIGADEAVRIDCEPNDPYQVAFQISDFVKSNAFDIIFCGKETIDYNGSEVGGMIAGMLDRPFASLCTSLNIEGAKATMKRDISGGEETFSCNLPLVVSSAKGMAEARIPNMRGIMAARTKPLLVLPPVKQNDLTAIINYELPKEKSGCKMISADNVEELVSLLHNEAKVI